MTLKPLHDQVVVREQDAETKTPGGLVLPDVAQKRLHRGEVLAIGCGRLLKDGQIVALVVKPGEIIVWPEHEGVEVKVDGEKFIVLRESAILGVLEG